MTDEIGPHKAVLDGSAASIEDLIFSDDKSVRHIDQLKYKAGGKLKRAFDFIIAATLLVTVLPLVCLIALLIALNGQRAFCSDIRIGRGGRAFRRLTFSIMRDDVSVPEIDVKLVWKTHGGSRQDPRVTRLGKILLGTGLDELPTLINVLSGDMSFVGPRPVTGDELARISRPSQTAAYLAVRPGVIGTVNRAKSAVVLEP